MRKDIDWINHAKFICMLFVYLDHSEIFGGCKIGTIRNLYLPVFVNTFFFISGFLLFGKQLSNDMITQKRAVWLPKGGKNILSNICWKLVVPTVIFSFLLYFPKIMVRGVSFSWYSLLCDTVLGGSIWFTSALAVAELLIFLMLVSRSRSIWPYVFLGICTAIVSYLLFVNHISFDYSTQIPWAYRSGLSAVFIMTLGGVYWKFEQLIDSLFCDRNRLVLYILMAGYMISCLFYFRYYCGTLLRHPLNLVSIPIIFIGIYTLIYFCKKMPHTSIACYFGRHSLGLYLISGAIPNIIAVSMLSLLPRSVGTTLVIWLLSILIAMVTIFFMNRYIPFIFDLRLLKRTK